MLVSADAAPQQPARNGHAQHHWSALLASEIMPGEVSLSHEADDAGTLSVRRLANGGKLAEVHAAPQQIVHSALDVSALPEDALMLTVTYSGNGRVVQGGRQFDFGPGDILFRRARVPSLMQIRQTVHQSFLWIPAAELKAYMPLSAGFEAVHFPADAVTAEAMHETTLRAGRMLATLPAASAAALERGLVQMALSAYLEGSAAHLSLSPRDLLWQRCMAFIDAHLSDPELDARRCADALRVSPRYFFRLLETHGVRFRAHLLEQRLQRIHQALQAAPAGRLNLSAVAFQHGFSDAAHFSQAFRKRFGCSPSTLRLAMRADNGCRAQ